MRTLRSLVLAVTLATTLAACGATDERTERASEPRPQPSVTAPPPVPVSVPSSSPLARRIIKLDSAKYEPNEHRARTNVPLRLHIDDLAVDAAVEDVGVAPDGTMEIPGPHDVGWYRYGPAPGEQGSVVLAGHIAFDGVDGAFRRLSEIDNGTRVDVTMKDGSTRAYRVVNVDRYRKESLPAAIWTKRGPERLVLITCGGSFDAERRRYDSNVVATAVPISEP